MNIVRNPMVVSRLYLMARYALMLCVKLRWRLRDVHITGRIISPRFISRDLNTSEFVFINQGAYICPRVSIGKYTMLAPFVTIAGADHIIDSVGVPMHFSGRPDLPETTIGDDVWIGANVCISAGVCIGHGSIIGMGSVVTKNIPPYSIAVGVPARVIRSRFSAEEAKLHDSMLSRPASRGEFCQNR